MKTYEVECTYADKVDNFEVANNINNIISRRRENGWEFVPPMICTYSSPDNIIKYPAKLILTFVKKQEE